jgi:hypothetical protein
MGVGYFTRIDSAPDFSKWKKTSFAYLKTTGLGQDPEGYL